MLVEQYSARASSDLSNHLSLGERQDFGRMQLRDHEDNSYSHVENLVHLLSRNSAAPLDQPEYRRDFPRRCVDQSVASSRECPWQIIDQAATGDMCGALDSSLRDRGHERLIILVDPKEFFPKRLCEASNFLEKIQLHLIQKDFPRQRVSIRVQAIRRQGNQDVRGHDSTAIQDLRPVNQTDYATNQIVLPGVVQIRKLRSFSANQGASALSTRSRESGNQLIEDSRVKAFRSYIVEEKQRARTHNRYIVYAVVHEVLSDRCVSAQRDCYFKLGTDAIDTRDENRFFHPPEICLKQSAKSACPPQDFRTKRRPHPFLQPLLDAVSHLDVNAGGSVRLLLPHFSHFNPAKSWGYGAASLNKRERALRRSIVNLSSSVSVGIG